MCVLHARHASITFCSSFFVALQVAEADIASKEKAEKGEEAADFNEDDAAAAAAEDAEEIGLDGNQRMKDAPLYNKGLIDFQQFNTANYEKVHILAKCS